MTIANNVASKLFVAFVAAAMLFSLATPAKAATVEELQAQIAALMAQITSLSGGASASASACTFTRALTVGSQGSDVTCLQTYLTSTGHFSNAGGATGYFGPVTQAAVAAWQSANGVSPAAGYFGPVSQAKYNALMAMSGGDNGGNNQDDDDDDSSTGGLSGEASLKSFDIEDGEDVELEEGQMEESVQELVVEFEDGDAMITRLDINLDTDATDDIWDVLGEVTLYVDGDEVASIDASDEDEWRDGTSTSDDTEGDLRFSGLDIVAEEDEELTITLGIEVQDNLDDTDQTITVDVTSMRFVDGDDVTTTEDAAGVGADANTFQIGAAGSEDELIVKSSTEDPNADTLLVEDDTVKSDWYTIFAFDLDTDDSTNDIELDTVGVQLTTGAADVDNVVDDAELVIDGTTYDDWEWNTVTGSNVMTLLFDIDGDHVIDAGDRVTVELRTKFFGNNAGAQFAEGETIQAVASTSVIDAEGVEDVTPTGSATGDQHTLRSSGVGVSDFDADSSVTNLETDDSNSVTFTFNFSVEAIGDEEVYIPLTHAAMDDAGSTTKGVVYRIEDSNGNLVASSSADTLSANFQYIGGDGDTDTSGFIHLNSGDVADVRLSVTFNPGSAAGYYTAILDSVNFKVGSAATPDETTTLSPETNYDVTTDENVRS